MIDPTPNHKRITVQQHSENEPPFEVYHLSHDLRGPLNSMLGFTELLLEEIEGPLTNIQKEDISAINQSAQNLLRLINNMVDVSKLDAGHLELALGEVELRAVMDEALASDFWVAQAADVDVTINLAADLPPVWADRPRLVQMFEELLAWARIKGTRQVEITAGETANGVDVQIELKAVIVPEQDMEDIFRLITRQDAAGRNHLGPGGLELPLVRRLAEKQRAAVWAAQTGNGTSFHLVFPTGELQE